MFPMLVKGMKCPNATFFYLESIYSRVMKESYIRNVTIIKFKNFFLKSVSYHLSGPLLSVESRVKFIQYKRKTVRLILNLRVNICAKHAV